MRVRGLKLFRSGLVVWLYRSHSMRVRGLKPRRNQHTALEYASHPMRVRWLKCKLLYSVVEFVLALHSR